ncbi:hypothetical protein SAMN05216244_0793 [Sediminibacillus halophilus]|uniref:Uncharacterized protein n=1 Tax=Sediminibacillus halophilus TaxID=482461 RepID=A0A1G9MZU4_9BACI|nr:hypothetical protein SAMN05216244_0793 [Sediminibacillus halophilus]
MSLKTECETNQEVPAVDWNGRCTLYRFFRKRDTSIFRNFLNFYWMAVFHRIISPKAFLLLAIHSKAFLLWRQK